jgi:hypothetical protein
VKLRVLTVSSIFSASVALVAPVVLAAPAQAAAACGTTVSDKDGSGWSATANGNNMRTGSSTSCSVTGVAYSGQKLDYHCYTVAGDYGWTYTRNVATGAYGWIRDDLLSDNGSDVWCGF